MAMTDADFSLSADAESDDLPRTLRRERDARAREARAAKERETREREDASLASGTSARARPSAPSYSEPPAYLARAVPAAYGDEPVPAAVTRFDVPFFRLMAFFMKAVLAAVPALILLGAMLYFGGRLLEAYFPELVRMKIMITFPTA